MVTSEPQILAEELGVAINFTITAIITSDKSAGERNRLTKAIAAQVHVLISDFNTNSGQFSLRPHEKGTKDEN